MPSIQFTNNFCGSARDIAVIKQVLENEDSQTEFRPSFMMLLQKLFMKLTL